MIKYFINPSIDLYPLSTRLKHHQNPCILGDGRKLQCATIKFVSAFHYKPQTMSAVFPTYYPLRDISLFNIVQFV